MHVKHGKTVKLMSFPVFHYTFRTTELFEGLKGITIYSTCDGLMRRRDAYWYCTKYKVGLEA
jgi:hypothetical protein